jgi:hypothetical protein
MRGAAAGCPSRFFWFVITCRACSVNLTLNPA